MIDKLKVGGNNYDVLFTDVVELDGDKNYFGTCDYANNEIKVLNTLSLGRQYSVLIHELTHAIFHEAGYTDHEEDTVNRIAIVLSQVLLDNNALLNSYHDKQKEED